MFLRQSGCRLSLEQVFEKDFASKTPTACKARIIKAAAMQLPQTGGLISVLCKTAFHYKMMFMLLWPVFNPWIWVPTQIPPKTYFLVAIVSTRIAYPSSLQLDLWMFHSEKCDSCSHADKSHSGKDSEAECYSCIVILRWCRHSKAEQNVSQNRHKNKIISSILLQDHFYMCVHVESCLGPLTITFDY